MSYDFSGKANFQTKGFAGTNRFISNEMKDDEEYSFPLDVKVFGLVAHRVLNLLTGKEAIFKEDITQENFSIPDHYDQELFNILRSCLATNPVDRPILAELAMHPLFREFITLKPVNKTVTATKYGTDGKVINVNAYLDGF